MVLFHHTEQYPAQGKTSGTRNEQAIQNPGVGHELNLLDKLDHKLRTVF